MYDTFNLDVAQRNEFEVSNQHEATIDYDQCKLSAQIYALYCTSIGAWPMCRDEYNGKNIWEIYVLLPHSVHNA